MEEVEAEDPMAHVRRIHQAKLALASRVLHVSGDWELVGDVIDLERKVLERVIVISAAHASRQSVL